jgi:hypothetical protein
MECPNKASSLKRMRSRLRSRCGLPSGVGRIVQQAGSLQTARVAERAEPHRIL